MKQKNQRNSKRRLNSLILLVAFTAIMLIVSTYAWFSINKEVSITSLTGDVTAVEGLQISLDAKNWSNTIDLSKLSIVDTGITYPQGISNTNVKPTTLTPVSTTGVVDTNSEKLPMFNGKYDGNKGLSNITLQGETTGTGYYAFDVYLMNSSASTDPAALSLTSTSSVQIKENGDAASGLQNTVRVGLAKFNTTADVTDDQATIISKTYGVKSGEEGQEIWTLNKLADAAIWEPNADKHVENIVINNNFLKLKDADKGSTTVTDSINKFTDNMNLPTYALNKNSVGKTITDIYEWNAIPGESEEPKAPVLGKQLAVQTKAAGITDKVALTSTSNASNAFAIAGNQITRMRIYVWLEGQDVDCTNYASHGGGITLSLGLAKN